MRSFARAASSAAPTARDACELACELAVGNAHRIPIEHLCSTSRVCEQPFSCVSAVDRHCTAVQPTGSTGLGTATPDPCPDRGFRHCDVVQVGDRTLRHAGPERSKKVQFSSVVVQVSAVAQQQCLRADEGVATTAAHQAKKRRGCASRTTSGGRLLARWGMVQARAQRTRQQEQRRWQPTAQGMVRLVGRMAARTQQDEAPSCHGQKMYKSLAEKLLMTNLFAQKFCMHPTRPAARMLSRLRSKASGRGGEQMRRCR